jgi:hypothetical protein
MRGKMYERDTVKMMLDEVRRKSYFYALGGFVSGIVVTIGLIYFFG